MARGVQQYAASHDDPTADDHLTPLLNRGDWLRLATVAIEIAVLVWLLQGHTIHDV